MSTKIVLKPEHSNFDTIQKFIGHRVHPSTGVFLLKVRWVGWGAAGDTEEPIHTMVADDPHRVEEYLSQRQDDDTAAGTCRSTSERRGKTHAAPFPIGVAEAQCQLRTSRHLEVYGSASGASTLPRSSEEARLAAFTLQAIRKAPVKRLPPK